MSSRRIEEPLRSTGASIDVFSAARLDELGITTLSGVADYAPNVIIESKSGNAADGLTIKIRGIGVSDVDYLYSDPSVALYIDGVFQSRAQGPQAELLNVDRIEVLRGPQGTLYGKNALGGAINIITRKPNAEDRAELAVTAGNYGQFGIRGRANTELVGNTVFGSLAVFSVERDGFYRNTFQRGVDPSNAARQGLRGALRLLAGDAIVIDVVSDYSDQRQTAAAWRLLAVVPGGLAATALQTAGFNAATYLVGTNPSSAQLANVALNNDAGVWAFLPPSAGQRGRSADDATFSDQALIIAAALSPTVSLRSTSGYRVFNRFVAADIDGTPAAIADQVLGTDGHSLTSEMQLNSSMYEGRLSLLAGVFGLRERLFEDQSNGLLLGLADSEPVLQGLSRRQARAYDNESWAAYSHAVLALTDALRISSGLRYSWERKQDHEVDSDLATGGVVADTEESRAWTSTTPQWGVEYAATPHVFTYATIAKGYASGGYSSFIKGIGIQQYDPESLWSYEAGIKADALNGSLVMNGSVFFMDYRNVVVQSFGYATNGTPVNVYTNAGRAQVRGMDITCEWSPNRELAIVTGVGILSQRFLEYGIGANGEPIPAASAHFFDSPALTASSTVHYLLPMKETLGSLALNAGWSYRSRTYFDNSFSITSSQRPYSLFNGQLTYVLPGQRLTASLYGENIGDSVYLTRTLNTLASLGAAFAAFGPPREYGLRLQYKF